MRAHGLSRVFVPDRAVDAITTRYSTRKKNSPCLEPPGRAPGGINTEVIIYKGVYRD